MVLYQLKRHTEGIVSKQKREERIFKVISLCIARTRGVSKEKIGKKTKTTDGDFIHLCAEFEASKLPELQGVDRNLTWHDGMTVEQLSRQIASKWARARKKVIRGHRDRRDKKAQTV